MDELMQPLPPVAQHHFAITQIFDFITAPSPMTHHLIRE
jgi:hypothetical protein